MSQSEDNFSAIRLLGWSAVHEAALQVWSSATHWATEVLLTKSLGVFSSGLYCLIKFIR